MTSAIIAIRDSIVPNPIRNLIAHKAADNMPVSAIVTGATGMLGRAIVFELGKHPENWKTVYALARSKKEDFPPNVVNRHLDLRASAEDMAKELADTQAEYVFFSAYLQKDTEEENWQVNGDMLKNFLDALEITGGAKTTKRIILVTGAKQYGVHLGAPKNPLVESDPWLTDEKRWPPNFYYRQQDILADFCRKHGHISWVVTYPNDVVGVAKGNFMNLATSLGVYAAVARELGQDLAFPGSEAFYTRFDTFTSSKLHAEFCHWAAFEPRAANQAFNVVNGDAESWQRLWPLLAKRFGLKVKQDQFSGTAPLSSSVQLAETPPLALWENEAGLAGRVEPSRLESRIDLARWSQQDEVKKAWQALAEREGLDKEGLEKATWAFTSFVLGRNYDILCSMSKAREFGWTGYCDTWSSFCDAFDDLEKEGILPKCG